MDIEPRDLLCQGRIITWAAKLYDWFVIEVHQCDSTAFTFRGYCLDGLKPLTSRSAHIHMIYWPTIEDVTQKYIEDFSYQTIYNQAMKERI